MGRGRPRKIVAVGDVKNEKKTTSKSTTQKIKCIACDTERVESEFYAQNSIFYANGKIPCCKDCLKRIYDYYLSLYREENNVFPEKKAICRMCMGFNLYYSEEVFESALDMMKKFNSTLFASYMRVLSLTQNRNKTYDTTVFKEMQNKIIDSYINLDENRKVKQKTINFFGSGFSDDDYLYLQEEYNDWTARHECNTKAQEEIFKRICFTQLELLKATRTKQDTKDLTATFQKLLDTAKLQPKQNANETVSDAQTFGTLIDKWENTKPIAEVEEDLKDVDKIGKYINIFYKGHLAKMMGLKNGYSKSYEDFMKQYSVTRPEYESDEDGEVLFDAIFGGQGI